MASFRSISWRTSLAIILLLPFLYVLSVGPVSWMDEQRWIDGETFVFLTGTFYAPLEWCYSRCEPLHRFLIWHNSLWID